MGVKKLLHTRYRVDDLEKTVRFYTDILGLEEVARHKSSRGSELVFLKAPGSEEQIELCCYPKSGPVKVQADLTHLAFEVEDMDSFVKEISSKGVALSEQPSASSSGSVIAFLDAPEGYEIEIIQRAKKPAHAKV